MENTEEIDNKNLEETDSKTVNKRKKLVKKKKDLEVTEKVDDDKLSDEENNEKALVPEPDTDDEIFMPRINVKMNLSRKARLKRASNPKKKADKFEAWQKKTKEEQQKCTKEEYAVAKYMRFNAPVREAKFVPVGNFVRCFIASKVVDALMDSKWAKGKSKGDVQFTDRKSCVAFCDKLLSKGLFHRAMKIKSKKKRREEELAAEEEKKKKRKSKKDTDSKKDSEKESKKETDEESKKEKDAEKSDEKEDTKKDDEKKKDDDKKKKEKKLRLDMHEDQRFVDGEEIYVWIYDPVPAKTFIIGLLMVIGAAALCLFPLWPGEMRIGVYYISLVGASFVGFILLLVLLRFILFCGLWVVTLGKLHFWLLPNLTEDVGFFDSFRPLYTFKVHRASDKDSEKEKKKEKKIKKEIKGKEKESEKEETETGDDLDRDEEQEEQEFEMVQPEDVDFDDEEGEDESGEGQSEEGDQYNDNEEEEEEEEQIDIETKKEK